VTSSLVIALRLALGCWAQMLLVCIKPQRTFFVLLASMGIDWVCYKLLKIVIDSSESGSKSLF